MTWLFHPYRRYILLGALLYGGMAWLGYQAGEELGIATECEHEIAHCPRAAEDKGPLEMTTDTLAIVHYFNRAKAVRPLPRPISPVVDSGLKVPRGARRIPPPPPPWPRHRKFDCGMFRIFGQMPIFPGCDEMTPYEEHKACGEQKLLEFVYGNVRYPANAREQRCSGTALIEFIVLKNGRIGEAEIIADPSCGLGQVALAAVMAMNKQDIVWTPGQQGGISVAVKFSLPIRFKLE